MSHSSLTTKTYKQFADAVYTEFIAKRYGLKVSSVKPTDLDLLSVRAELLGLRRNCPNAPTCSSVGEVSLESLGTLDAPNAAPTWKPTTWGSITGLITDQTDLISYLQNNYYPLSDNPAGYLTDAPSDGSFYARRDGSWQIFTPTLNETDPVFTASPAAGITNANITNWNTAYGWGNHATAGYLISFTETDPVFGASAAAGISPTDITNWNNAYGWGDHSLAGYALSDGSNATGTWSIDISGDAATWGSQTYDGIYTSGGINFLMGYNAVTNKWQAIGQSDVQSWIGANVTETDPVFTAWLTTPPDVSTFNNDAGYLTSVPTLQQVTTAGNTSTNSIYVNSPIGVIGVFNNTTLATAGVQILGNIAEDTGVLYVGKKILPNNIRSFYIKGNNLDVSSPDISTIQLPNVHNKTLVASVNGNYADSTGAITVPTITGSGTTNYVPKWSSSSALTDSSIFDDGTSVGIGTNVLDAVNKLQVNGNITATRSLIGSNDPTKAIWVSTYYGNSYVEGTHYIRAATGYANVPLVLSNATNTIGLKFFVRPSATRNDVQMSTTTGNQLGFAVNNGDVQFAIHSNGGALIGTGYARTGVTSTPPAQGLAIQGSLLVGTDTDAGYKFDAYGTSRLYGDVKIGQGVYGGINGLDMKIKSYPTGSEAWIDITGGNLSGAQSIKVNVSGANYGGWMEVSGSSIYAPWLGFYADITNTNGSAESEGIAVKGVYSRPNGSYLGHGLAVGVWGEASAGVNTNTIGVYAKATQAIGSTGVAYAFYGASGVIYNADIPNEMSDPDKILVSSSGVVKYMTKAQLGIGTGGGGGGGGTTRSISTVSSNTAAGSTANTDYVYVVTAAATITLPTAVANTNAYTIKRTGSGTVTVATTSAETIDGSSSATINVQYQSITLVSNGTNWVII